MLFYRVKAYFKDKYMGVTTPIALQNEVSEFWKMYYDKETLGMVNQSVNNFHTRLLLNIDALPQDEVFPLDISENFFKKKSWCSLVLGILGRTI